MTQSSDIRTNVLPVEDWQWLADQLRAWPIMRVHPDRTMFDGALRPMAADVIEAAMGRIRALEAERDRAIRNRDMWKGQCERQAEQLGASKPMSKPEPPPLRTITDGGWTGKAGVSEPRNPLAGYGDVPGANGRGNW